jgi:predicted neutral ceramidase superfamily lipid hydrolase
VKVLYLTTAMVDGDRAHSIQLRKMAEAFSRIADVAVIGRKMTIKNLAFKRLQFIIIASLCVIKFYFCILFGRSFDAVYCRDKFSLFSAVIAGRFPVFYEAHNTNIPLWLLNNTAGVVAISSYIAEQFIRRGIKNIIIARSGVSL